MRSEAVADQGAEQAFRGEEAEKQLSHWQWFGIGILALLIVAAVFFFPVGLWVRTAAEWTSELGWVGMVLFVLLYTVTATLGLPVTPLNIGAGVLFGWWIGFFLALSGGVGAATISFLLGRFLFQNWLRRHLACYPTPQAILEDVHESPWSAIITLRLHPFIPASVKNYMFGISDVRLSVYAAATAIAYAPVVFLYSYLGAAGFMTIDRKHEWTPLMIVLYSLGLLGAIVLTWVLTWYGRRRIAEIRQRLTHHRQPAV